MHAKQKRSKTRENKVNSNRVLDRQWSHLVILLENERTLLLSLARDAQRRKSGTFRRVAHRWTCSLSELRFPAPSSKGGCPKHLLWVWREGSPVLLLVWFLWFFGGFLSVRNPSVSFAKEVFWSLNPDVDRKSFKWQTFLSDCMIVSNA